LNEPISVSTALGGLLTTGVALIAIFVPGLSQEAQLAIIAFGNAVILTGVVLYSRARSTPVSNPVLPENSQVTVVTADPMQPNPVVTLKAA
jgi:hypothetical protein